MNTLDLTEIVEQFAEVSANRREPLFDEVEYCIDWLANQGQKT